MLALNELTDDDLVDRPQRGAFDYFSRYTNADNGLVADTSRLGSPCSIAVVGFALSCYPVAVERGWMSRSDAALLVLKTLHFFWNSSQGEDPDALYRRVDWQWAQNGLLTVSQGWKPQCGFLHYGWEGYNEATIVYVLGIGSPPHPREVTTLPSLDVTP